MDRPFLELYRVAANLIPSADDAVMAETYVGGVVVPQEQKGDGASDGIEALFNDNDDMAVPAMIDEQVALLALVHAMVAERVALATMLVVRANAARKAARVATEERAVHEAMRVA
jgi:hypothetical protein